jgi:mono/diheme cytochrome c family protein
MTCLLRIAGVPACAGLLLFCAQGQAETFDRGQALYENHCQTCHDETAHTRESRRATSVGDLHRWVATWSYHAALGWSGEEIDDVVDYLNRRFYHFTDRP